MSSPPRVVVEDDDLKSDSDKMDISEENISLATVPSLNVSQGVLDQSHEESTSADVFSYETFVKDLVSQKSEKQDTLCDSEDDSFIMEGNQHNVNDDTQATVLQTSTTAVLEMTGPWTGPEHECQPESDPLCLDIQGNLTDLSDEESEVTDYAFSTEVSSSEESDSGETNEVPEPCCETPLYEDAPVSLTSCLVAVLIFSIRYSLSTKCLSDLLKLIFLICRSLNCQMTSTTYQFWKYFSNLKSPVKYHYFCSDCMNSLPAPNSKCPFAAQHANRTAVSYFIELPLVDQVKALFERKKFSESLTHRFRKQKMNHTHVEDVYDGKIYMEEVEKGFLSFENPYNFSLLGNSDGVPVYRSSSTSLWPVYFAINELPYNQRFLQENILLGGLWYGANKPNGNIVMETFRTSLMDLYRGVKVKIFETGASVVARGKLLIFTCDLPAKCMFMGMTQFNGEYGCNVCLQRGESVEIPIAPKGQKKNSVDETKKAKKRVWVYKYTSDMDLRNCQATVNFGKEAQLQREQFPNTRRINVFGVQQPCALSQLMPDFVRGMAVDVMHCVFLGVIGKLAELWFGAKYKNKPYSLFKYLDSIDTKLMKIRPPNYVQRNVRSIALHMKHWKASEWKNFLFYYSVPLLEGILPSIYLENYLDLVLSLNDLYSVSISPAQILSCATRLKKFVRSFENLYGECHMSINFHLLLHLPYVVTNLGPLWAYSCAPFENLNGLMLKIITGTRHVQTQLANCAFMVLHLPLLLDSLLDSRVKDICYSLMHPSVKLKFLESITSGVFSVGTYKIEEISQNLKVYLKKAGFFVKKNQTFMKLKRGRFLHISESYKRQKKCVSSYVSFMHNGVKRFGSITSFHRLSPCSCSKPCTCRPAWFLAFLVPKTVIPYVRMLNPPEVADRPFLYKVIGNETPVVVDIESFLNVLFYVEVGQKCYVCEPINTVELEL